MTKEAKVALQLLIIRDLALKAIAGTGDARTKRVLEEIAHRAEDAQFVLEHGRAKVTSMASRPRERAGS